MYCSECGLEIKGKRHRKGTEVLCDDCQTRQLRKSNLDSARAVANSTTDSASGVQTYRLDSGTNFFENQEAYQQHVNAVRTKLFIPKIAILGATFVFLTLIMSLDPSSPKIILPIYLIIFAIVGAVFYYKFFRYSPELTNLVIVQGTLQRRIFKSKNDDKSYKLTGITKVNGGEMMKLNSKGEWPLRASSQLVKAYLGKDALIYIDARLDMVLACKGSPVVK